MKELILIVQLHAQNLQLKRKTTAPQKFLKNFAKTLLSLSLYFKKVGTPSLKEFSGFLSVVASVRQNNTSTVVFTICSHQLFVMKSFILDMAGFLDLPLISCVQFRTCFCSSFFIILNTFFDLKLNFISFSPVCVKVTSPTNFCHEVTLDVLLMNFFI